MSWVAAGITVVGAVGGALASKQKAPKAAEYKPVDINSAVTQSADANAQGFAKNSALAAKSNSFDLSQQQQLMEKAMPGFGALQKRLMGQVNSDLDSQTNLPQDVSDKISQMAAEKGISRGTSGNFNGFSLVKDFGFNLVDWQNAKRASALQTLSSVYGMAPRVNPMSPSSMFVTPNAALGVQQNNNGMQFNSQQANNNAQAAAANNNASMWGGVISTAAGAGAGAYATKMNAPKKSQGDPDHLFA